jgi:ABC-type polysaccharide/polyol phosphate export permease
VTVNDGVIVVPVIIPQSSEMQGPVPLWAWIVVGVVVTACLALIGWLVYDEWTDDL